MKDVIEDVIEATGKPSESSPTHGRVYTATVLRGVTVAGLAVLAAAAGVTGALANTSTVREGNVVLRGGGTAPPGATARRALAWCGGTPSATDRQPDLDISSPDQVHVVYAVPSDGADRFSDYASRIATDAAAIDSWWQGQDPARTPR